MLKNYVWIVSVCICMGLVVPTSLAFAFPRPETSTLQPAESSRRDVPLSERRDPFKPLLETEVVVSAELVPTYQPPRTELERYDVEQFEVKGIIVGDLGQYARILAPDGKSYTILVGTRMGRFGGSVVKISEHAVIIQETRRYQQGQKVVEKNVETSLYLNPLDEETPGEHHIYFLSGI